MRRLLAFVLVVAMAITLASCGGPQVSPPKPTSIKITSAPVLLTKVGDTAQLQATVYDQNGDVLKNQPITWSSSSTSDVSVGGNGEVTANASVGSAMITASSSGLSAQALVPVAQLAPTSRIVPKSLVTNTQVNSDGTLSVTLDDSGAVTGLAVGDIIVSNAGIMARIISSTHSGGTLLVQATPVSLDDAFDAVHFSTSTSANKVVVTTSLSPTGVRVSSTSPLVTPQSLDLSAVKCKTQTGDITLDLTGGSIDFVLNPQFRFTYDKPVGGTGTFSVLQGAKPRVSMNSPTLKLAIGLNVSATCKISGLKDITIPTPASFFGIVTLAGHIGPEVGFKVSASLTGASVTVAGPSLKDAGADAEFGVTYSNGSWSTTRHAALVSGTFKWFTFDANGKPSETFKLKPYVLTNVGFMVDFAAFPAIGVDFATPELSLGFGLDVGSVGFDVNSPSYAGPTWSGAFSADAGFKVSLSGEAAKTLKRFGIKVTLAQVNYNLFNWEFMHSPQPGVTPTTATVTTSVGLSTAVPARYQGAKVEFWGYASGATSATELASTTVKSDGTASATWTPAASDNGTMKVYALLYGDAFSALGAPYSTPSTDRATVTVAVPSGAATITTFQASPNPATAGSSTTFTWAISGGSGTPSCTIDPGDGSALITISDCGSTTSQAYTYASAAGSPYTATLSIQGTTTSKTTVVTVDPGSTPGPTVGLIGYYTFDACDGTDSSGNGNAVVYSAAGSPSCVAGVSGQALSLDGTDYMATSSVPANLPSGTHSRTMTAWVSMSSGNDSVLDQSVTGFGAQSPSQMFELQYGLGQTYVWGIWLFGCDNDVIVGSPTALCYNTYGTPGTVQLSQWYFLAATYDNASQTTTLYVDGQEAGYRTKAIDTGSSPFFIGFPPSANAKTNGFHGAIDNVRLYDRLLSPSEIQGLFANSE